MGTWGNHTKPGLQGWLFGRKSTPVKVMVKGVRREERNVFQAEETAWAEVQRWRSMSGWEL